MIGKILSGIFSLIMGLVTVILSPIDLLIAEYLPDLNSGLNYVNNLFSFINGVIGYCVDASGITDIAIGLVVAYWVFVLTVPLTFSSIKLALKWYNSLKI